MRIKCMFYSRNTCILTVKFQVCWYEGTLGAIISPGLRIILILVDVTLKVVLQVNVTPLSLELNCVISDDVTVVDVLI